MKTGIRLVSVFAVMFGVATMAAAETQPSEQKFQEWLAAFNRGGKEAYGHFLESNYPTRVEKIGMDLQARMISGGFELRKTESETATEFTGLLQERDSDNFMRIVLDVDPAAQNHITKLTLAPTPRPAEFAIPRLTDKDLAATLDKTMRADVEKDKFAGIVVVAHNDKQIFSGIYGMADREHHVPVARDTRFRMGSMNKMFTATATMQLVQAGKIGLNEPIAKYLPDYPNKELASQVTIHHLLTYTGGTGDIFTPEYETHRLDLKTLQDYVALYGARGLRFPPGSKWEYSNYGMLLLGVIIEKVSGQSYYDYVESHIFKPAGMTSTASLPEDQTVPRRSVGYMHKPDSAAWVPNNDTLPYRGTSAGGGYTTVDDLLKFAHALMTHKLLNARFTDLLIAGKVATNGPGGARYAYGFSDLRDKDGKGWVGHAGGAPGMNGDLRIYPKSGYVVVVLANLDPPAAQRIAGFVDMRLPL